MNGLIRLLASFSDRLQSHLLWLLIGAYVLATGFPGIGLQIRDASFEITVFHEHERISLLLVLLAALLFNAGLGVRTGQIGNLARDKLVLFAGVLANLMIPIAFIVVVTQVMHWWHNPDETQSLLVGLALAASMPIVGSSTAWALVLNYSNASVSSRK